MYKKNMCQLKHKEKERSVGLTLNFRLVTQLVVEIHVPGICYARSSVRQRGSLRQVIMPGWLSVHRDISSCRDPRRLSQMKVLFPRAWRFMRINFLSLSSSHAPTIHNHWIMDIVQKQYWRANWSPEISFVLQLIPHTKKSQEQTSHCV